jgi:hypothetical protein
MNERKVYLNGYNADVYDYPKNRHIIIEKIEEGYDNPKFLIVTKSIFEKIIHKQNGNFKTN